MRVVVDYGLTGPRTPPKPLDLPGAQAAGSARAGAQSGQAERRETVLIVHAGNSRPESARGLHGSEAAGLLQAPNRSQSGGDGIPVPGTDLRMVTSEHAAQRDAEVRRHEQAHQLALGPYAESGIQLNKERGPDGEVYATGGSIKADLSEVPGNPRATLQKARTVQRAALAPGAPSAADLRAAAAAYRLAQEAQEQLAAERLDTSA